MAQLSRDEEIDNINRQLQELNKEKESWSAKVPLNDSYVPGHTAEELEQFGKNCAKEEELLKRLFSLR